MTHPASRETDADPGRSDPVPYSGPIPRLAAWIATLAAAVAAFLAFSPALAADFVNYDDTGLFVDNPAFRGLRAENLRWMFTTALAGHWAPLTWISHGLDYVASGLDPHAFHRTNLLLHAANAAMFCVLAAKLLAIALPREAESSPSAVWIAAGAAALLFGVHPLRTETVAWITERRGLLCTFFFLPAMLAYLKAVRPGRIELASSRWYLASILLLAMALMSKGLGLAFAAIVVVLDVYPLRRPLRGPNASAVWLQKLPFFALGLASAMTSSWAANFLPGTMKSLEEWGIAERLGTALLGLGYYVEKTLWPTRLAALVELPYRFDFSAPSFLVTAACVVAAASGIWIARKRAPALAAAAAVYVLALLPVLGLLQAGPQLVAERYSYLACMPWAILAGAGILVALARSGAAVRAALLAAVAATVALLVPLSRAQARTWTDSRTLFEHAIAVGRASSVAHVSLGGLALAAKDPATAIEHYQAAVAIRPDQGKAWFDLGIVYARAGRLEEAEHAGLQAVKWMKPAFMPLVNLGNLYRNKLSRLDDAITVYRRAVADAEAMRRLGSPVPYLVLGSALREKGMEEEGRRYLELAARFPETRAEALRELAARP